MAEPANTDPETFRTGPAPADDLALQALWWAARGAWDRAHDFAQAGEGTPRCDWVHAYLHRVEGDMENARYWYRRAGQTEAAGALDAEWSRIATALLAR